MVEMHSIAHITHDDTEWLLEICDTTLIRVVEVNHFVRVFHGFKFSISFAFLLCNLLVKCLLSFFESLLLVGFTLLDRFKHFFLHLLGSFLDNFVRYAWLLTLEEQQVWGSVWHAIVVQVIEA